MTDLAHLPRHANVPAHGRPSEHADPHEHARAPAASTSAAASVVADGARPVDATDRFHALDAVRGYALLLGILFHATMSFLDSPEQAWLVTDSSPSTTLTITFYVLHMFRMATFFLIAGFFAHMMFHRQGARAFMRDRLRRIGLPLVAGWPLVIALLGGGAIWGAWVMNGGQFPEAPPADPNPPFLAFPLTHLWFLYMLLWLYAGTLAVRAFLDRMLARAQARLDGLRTALDAGMRALVNAPPGLLLLALPTLLGLLAYPGWRPWIGVPTPDQSLLPNVAAAAAFGSTFVFGWLLHRQPQLLQVLERRAHAYLLLAISVTSACLWHVGLRVSGEAVAMDAPLVLYAAGYALALWAWTFAFIGLAMKYLSGYSASRRYIADASYWLYIVHLPLVLFLQIALSQLSLHWLLKLALILGIAMPIMLKSYRWWVRGTFIGAVLNGRRLPPA